MGERLNEKLKRVWTVHKSQAIFARHKLSSAYFVRMLRALTRRLPSVLMKQSKKQNEEEFLIGEGNITEGRCNGRPPTTAVWNRKHMSKVAS